MTRHPVDTGCKLNVHKTFWRRPERLLNVLCTFKLRPVSAGYISRHIIKGIFSYFTAQKMKFFIKDFFNKCDEIRRKLRIWSHLLKKSIMENFILCAVLCSFLEHLGEPKVNQFLPHNQLLNFARLEFSYYHLFLTGPKTFIEIILT